MADANLDGYDDESGAPLGGQAATAAPGMGVGTYDPTAPGGATSAPSGGVTSSSWPNGLPKTSFGVSSVPDTVYAWGEPIYGMGPMRPAGSAPMVRDPFPKVTKSFDDIKFDLNAMDDKDLAVIQKQLNQLGTFGHMEVGSGMNPETLGAFNGFLSYASELNSTGDRRTWDKILADSAKSAKKGGTGAEQPFTGTRVSTDSNTTLMSPTAAKRLAEQAYTELLGGTPNGDQMRQFREAMDRVANANPTVRTTSTSYDEGIRTGSDSTTTGGYDQQQVAIDKAKSQEGYAEYQGATKYMDALLSAISAPVGA